jgi:hypothetical protein
MQEMKIVRAANPRAARSERVLGMPKRVAIVLLLLAIPTLSTLAKKSWYLPQTDTARYLNGAIKMRVTHAPLLTDRAPLLATVNVVPPPVETAIRPAQPKPSGPDIAITVSLRHRSPPFALL